MRERQASSAGFGSARKLGKDFRGQARSLPSAPLTAFKPSSRHTMPPKASDPPSRANGSASGKGRTKSRQQMPRPPKGQLFGPESMRLKAGGPALAGVPRIPPPAPPLESDDWPEDVEELSEGYVASPGLPEPLRVQLCSAIDEADPLHPASTAGNVCFRWISANSSHPAAGQYGLFAAKDLVSGAREKLKTERAG